MGCVDIDISEQSWLEIQLQIKARDNDLHPSDILVDSFGSKNYDTSCRNARSGSIFKRVEVSKRLQPVQYSFPLSPISISTGECELDCSKDPKQAGSL